MTKVATTNCFLWNKIDLCDFITEYMKFLSVLINSVTIEVRTTVVDNLNLDAAGHPVLWYYIAMTPTAIYMAVNVVVCYHLKFGIYLRYIVLLKVFTHKH